MSVTFNEAIYKELRRPFTPAAVRFKIQGTFEGGAICIAYIDARLVAGRLNAVCPGDWFPVKYEPFPSGRGLICHLSVGGVVRADYGVSDYENAKGDYSDALKRAAVHFGVGESLYTVPEMILREGKHLKKNRKGKYVLTDQGKGELRNRYRLWLESAGVTAFGKPLDHGDVEPEERVEGPLDEFTRLAKDHEFEPQARKALWEFVNASEDNAGKAVEFLEADDVKGLLGHVSVAMGMMGRE